MLHCRTPANQNVLHFLFPPTCDYISLTTVPNVIGVLSDVLNYVLLNAKSTAEVGGRGKTQEKMGEEAVETVRLETGEEFECSSENVLVACFCFLKALTKNNIQVQRRCAMIIQYCTCNYLNCCPLKSNLLYAVLMLDHVQVI